MEKFELCSIYSAYDMHLSLNKMFNSGQILKLIGAIDDKLLEKSTSNLPMKPSWKSKDITPDESKQIFCRYEESLAIENELTAT